MDIDRVRYFCVFAEVGSLVRASEILHISQPALSKALRLLERETGHELLESDGRGLKLTKEGSLFLHEIQPLLEKWLNLPANLKSPSKKTNFRMASFEVFTTYFLGYLLGLMPEFNIDIHELGAGELERAVADGTVDLGITYIPIPTAGVEFIEVTKIGMGIFGLPNRFNDSLYSELPFVAPLAPIKGTPSKVMGLDGWPDHKFPRKIKWRVTMMESALELCRKGHAVAYLPEFVVRLHNENVKSHCQLQELKSPILKREGLQSTFLVQRAGAKDTPASRTIAKALRSLK